MNPLVKLMKEATETHGLTLDDLTVLSKERDPFRIGTPAHQRNADWLAEAIQKTGGLGKIHLRGLHYQLIGSVKLPNGKPYIQDDKIWKFTQEKAAFAARFLETVDFSKITDHRNDAPEVWTPAFEPTETWIRSHINVQIPSVDQLLPEPFVTGTFGQQAWRLAIVGEKTGLYDLVAPIAERYEATLALPIEEISTTRVEDIIAAAAYDERRWPCCTWQIAIQADTKCA